MYTVKVLVLKRFVPSVKGKNVSVKYVLVELKEFEYTYFAIFNFLEKQYW